MRYLDLFCGIGSFHQVLSETGAECVAACDSDPHARATYEAWHGITPHGRVEDMREDELPDYDMVAAGFPCQPFSQAGHRKGFADKRGHDVRGGDALRGTYVLPRRSTRERRVSPITRQGSHLCRHQAAPRGAGLPGLARSAQGIQLRHPPDATAALHRGDTQRRPAR